MQHEIADLRERVVALAAVKPRDAADAALRQQLALSTEGLPGKATDMLQAREVDPDLTLEDATIASTAELGAWLRDHSGAKNGIAIVRLRGERWQVTYTSST